jgi:hypothetical protein
MDDEAGKSQLKNPYKGSNTGFFCFSRIFQVGLERSKNFSSLFQRLSFAQAVANGSGEMFQAGMCIHTSPSTKMERSFQLNVPNRDTSVFH